MIRDALRFDERIGHRLLPGIQARAWQVGVPYLMRTNSMGFRTGEFEPSRPAGTRRILVYGDSFTEGVGVSDGKRFTDLLEEMVPDTEVLNFGLRASGTDQQLLLFREHAPDLEYDLVIVGLFTDDVKRNASRYGILTTSTGESYEKPYFQTEDGELTLHNVPVPTDPSDYGELSSEDRKKVYYSGIGHKLRMAVRQYAPWAKAALQRVTRYQPAPYLDDADDPAWTITRAIVEQWAAEADTPVLVLAIPPYQYFEGTASSSSYEERFSELASIPGVEVHDALPALRSAAKSGGAARLRIKGDAHYTAAGHRVLAESMAPTVAAVLDSATTSKEQAS